MEEKIYLTAQELLNDSFELGLRIFKSGFRPSFIIGVWRGGTPVGIAVQEILDHLGVKTDHIAIRTSSYTGIKKRDKTVRVHGLEYVIRQANWEDGLLIVDDVFDTGSMLRLHGLNQNIILPILFQIIIFTKPTSGWFSPTNWKASPVKRYSPINLA
jgi:hypoxanthine phosphoribosyltransferase